MDWASLIQSILGAVGGLAGQQKGEEANLQQLGIYKDILSRLKDIPLPELERMQAEQLGRPEAASADAATQAAQRAALSRFGQIAEGGVTPEERGAEEDIMSQANQRDQQARQAVLGQMAQRGTLDSGAALAEQMGAQGHQAQQAHEDATKLASSHYRNALNALSNQAQLAGQMSSEDFRRKSAADAVAAANARARAGAQSYNLGLPQANYANAISKIQAQANPEQAMAGWLGQSADRTRATYGGWGQAAGQAGSALYKGASGYKPMTGTDAQETTAAKKTQAGEDIPTEDLPYDPNNDLGY
jgi:hypothetical protein